MASSYSLEAINSLTDVEKQRIVLAYLHHNEPKNVDWAAAAAHSGAKTKESFKVSFGNSMKKLKTISEQTQNGSSAGNGAPGGTESLAANEGPRKRKRAAKGAAGADEGAEKAPKKRGRSKKSDVEKAEAEAKKADIEAFVDETIEHYIKSEQDGLDDE